jgi:hypothetical protein
MLAAGDGFRARTMVLRVMILVTVGKSELGYSENSVCFSQSREHADSIFMGLGAATAA